MMGNLIFLAVGILLGGAIAFLWLKTRKSAASAVSESEAQALQDKARDFEKQALKLEERLNSSERTALDRNDELSAERGSHAQAKEELARERERNANLEEKLKNQSAEIEKGRELLKAEFERLSTKLLEEKASRFTKQNQENIDQILKPLSERIADFRKKVEEVYDKESKERFSLENEMKRLVELNRQITQEAHNLTAALKGESKTQGNWGEMILETILEKSGLLKGVHFAVQQSTTTEEGRRLQPDVVIRLPEEKALVVDSKVSLTAYERYNATDDKKEKEVTLAQHIASVRGHVKELGDKNYQNLYGIQSPEVVFMFVPVEPAFALAVTSDPDLFYEAAEKKVAIVCQSTLLASLLTVASIWRQEMQNRNAAEIARQGGALYDNFVLFLDTMQELGKKLGDAQSAHEKAVKKLSSGKGNLVRRVENIRKLGAKVTKAIPDEFQADPDDLDGDRPGQVRES